MTDENQNTGVENTNPTPKFGSGEPNTEQPNQGSDTPEVKFGRDDVESLMKQNRDAQDFIKQLKDETASMRSEIKVLQEEVSKSKTIDELFDRYGQQNENTELTGQKTPQLDEQALLAKLKEDVFKDLSQAQQAELQQRNWNESVRLLKEKFGDGFATYVDTRANELGMSNSDIEAMARTHPKAFVELVGGGSKMRNPEPTRSSQSTLYSDPANDLEVRYARVSRLRRNITTEEGREAARQWSDPTFQDKYRQHILEKAQREGSQYGNAI